MHNICSQRTSWAIRAAISRDTRKSIATFAREYDRLQRERVAAFQEFRADVEKGVFPEDKHLAPIVDDEFESFVKGIEK